MQITQESIVDQLVTINVTIDVEDYLPKVEDQLKKIRREASIPGFRVGHVPKTLIEKRFKKSVTGEIVFKTAYDSFEKYIDSTEREYQIIGNPTLAKMPEDGDFAQEQSFLFTFTIHSVPKVDLTKIKTLSVQDYAIKVDDDLVDSYFLDKAIECFPFETVENDETIAEDKAYRIFPRIKSGESFLETSSHSSVLILSPLYPEIAKPFIGKKQGDVVEIAKKTFLDYSYQMHSRINIFNQNIDTDTVSIELKYIDKYAWEENYVEKMFEKYYPESEEKTESNLRQLISDDIDKEFKLSVDDYNKNHRIPNLLRDLFDVPIPTAGIVEELKHQHTSEKEENAYIPTQEEIESALKMYKLRYVYKQFMAENNISIESEEFEQHVEKSITDMYRGNVTEELVNSMKQYFYNNEEMRNRIYFQALNKKLMDNIAQQVQFSTPKSISYLEFLTLINHKD